MKTAFIVRSFAAYVSGTDTEFILAQLKDLDAEIHEFLLGKDLISMSAGASDTIYTVTVVAEIAEAKAQ